MISLQRPEEDQKNITAATKTGKERPLKNRDGENADDTNMNVAEILVDGKSIFPRLDVLVREVAAGKDSYSLPDVYKDLFNSND